MQPYNNETAMPLRRTYRREPVDRHRDQRIASALDLVAEGRPQAATVRAIADRAGVTPGLIRHYFASKDGLTREAYRRLMEQLTEQSVETLTTAPTDPAVRLVAFILTSLRPPITVAVGLWAGFLHDLRRDSEMRMVQAATCLGYRDRLQSLIADLPRDALAGWLRSDAIACSAIIDGLWLEGSVLPELSGPGDLERIALRSVGSILGLPLTRH